MWWFWNDMTMKPMNSRPVRDHGKVFTYTDACYKEVFSKNQSWSAWYLLLSIILYYCLLYYCLLLYIIIYYFSPLCYFYRLCYCFLQSFIATVINKLLALIGRILEFLLIQWQGRHWWLQNWFRCPNHENRISC